ncbi:MAG: tRNA (adenosine(37)-N6)-threonylcarbamoyltransferase complex dimerization subunit type 1 TsaB [Clostridiales bacterium]|jgi:tRNA threonylcarbamoyladenosine biosynthesis protein TsaB|nr:tRNA (adenosine(37)-N6)-threonylcarbamoyltransferase complex dimerization subunit type 1 TsaB [Clostridiales bacterium]
MKILAIDSTGNVASVAIVEDDKLVGELTTNFKKTHAEMLMPMAAHLLDCTETALSDIDYIACASGPGSFTGLRIGAATAKGLAFGAKRLIIPVPTLDALAYNVFNPTELIVPIMDARRQQVYTAFYTWSGGALARLSDYAALDVREMTGVLAAYSKKVVFLGDGVPVFKEMLEASGLDCTFAPAHINQQRAAAVGALALRLVQKDSAAAVEGKAFAPFYLRQSQAEREYEEKKKQETKEL